MTPSLVIVALCLVLITTCRAFEVKEDPLLPDIALLNSDASRILYDLRQYDALSRGISVEEYASTNAFSEPLDKRVYSSLYDYYINHYHHFYKFSPNITKVDENHSIYLFLADITTRGFEAAVPSIASWSSIRNNPQYKDKPSVDEVLQALTAPRNIDVCRTYFRPVPFFGGRGSNANHYDHMWSGGGSGGGSGHMVYEGGSHMGSYGGDTDPVGSLPWLLSRALEAYTSSSFANLDVVISTGEVSLSSTPKFMPSSLPRAKEMILSLLSSSISSASSPPSSSSSTQLAPSRPLVSSSIQVRSTTRWPATNVYPRMSDQAHAMLGLLSLCMLYIHAVAAMGWLGDEADTDVTHTATHSATHSVTDATAGTVAHVKMVASASSSTGGCCGIKQGSNTTTTCTDNRMGDNININISSSSCSSSGGGNSSCCSATANPNGAGSGSCCSTDARNDVNSSGCGNSSGGGDCCGSKVDTSTTTSNTPTTTSSCCSSKVNKSSHSSSYGSGGCCSTDDNRAAVIGVPGTDGDACRTSLRGEIAWSDDGDGPSQSPPPLRACLAHATTVRSRPLSQLGWATHIAAWLHLAQGCYLWLWLLWLLFESNPLALGGYVRTDAMELQHMALAAALLGVGLLDAMYARTLPRAGETLESVMWGVTREEEEEDCGVYSIGRDTRERGTNTGTRTGTSTDPGMGTGADEGVREGALSVWQHCLVAWVRQRAHLLMILPIFTFFLHVTIGINLYHHPQHSADSVWEHQLLASLLFAGALSSLYSRLCVAAYAPFHAPLRRRVSARVLGRVATVVTALGGLSYGIAGGILALFEEPPEALHFQHYYRCFTETQYVWVTGAACVCAVGGLGYTFGGAVLQSWREGRCREINNTLM